MVCPICRQMMVVLELDKVEIDYCPSCGGIWLDSGELELLFENITSGNEFPEPFIPQKNVKEKSRRCPKCSKKMEKVVGGNNVLIDRCKNGHGLWFDKDELQNIIQYEYSENNSIVPDLLKKIFGRNN